MPLRRTGIRRTPTHRTPGTPGTPSGRRTDAPAAPAAGPTRRRRAPGGRWAVVTAAPALAVCLASALTACGGGGDGGYTAVGPAGGEPRASARPTGSVTLVPLDGTERTPGGTASGSAAPGAGPAGTGSGSAGAADSAAGQPVSSGSAASPSTGRDGTEPRPSDPAVSNSPRPGASSSSPAPAVLTWSTPTRAATDRRWCEKVTVAFANSGGTAVRSGTVTLGTHIIDLLGIDWATIRATEGLPAPIAPGSRTSRTWTVCVDDWRVPLGMHVETRVVAVDWS
ncbi:hypothetical protein [Streptomyces fuscichromogenes]|uniref:hypothetical protein n=1 Tax=Streptomyces fuscichromogenes TaxID=1324013 RepID=UPI0027E5543F|nr:hypothetical protein [Streptomyces fuscichromogenes]